jgi:hypothetical protein
MTRNYRFNGTTKFKTGSYLASEAFNKYHIRPEFRYQATVRSVEDGAGHRYEIDVVWFTQTGVEVESCYRTVWQNVSPGAAVVLAIREYRKEMEL